MRAPVALGLLATALAVQDAPQRPPFKSGVSLVYVDATVLDEIRRPIHGLGVPDFTILEDGLERPVVALSEMTAPDFPPEGPAGSTARLAT